MSTLETDDTIINFLTALYQKANGDAAFRVSMFEVGEAIGLDKDAAQKTAENLIGEGLVEIKTLSGGIGITESGINEIEGLMRDQAGEGHALARLSDSVILGQNDRQLIERAILNLKHAINELNLDFNNTADFIIDIKTIELQLTSSTPKTAIIRECFNSIKTCLEKSKNLKALNQIRPLLEEQTTLL